MKFQSSNLKYDFDDILIEPAKVSWIESRKNIRLDYFPLIIAPMESVIDENNYKFFMDQDFSITYPRNKTFYASDLKNRKPLFFKSYGLEFDAYYHYYIDGLVNTPILIDVANGNMNKIIDIIKHLKEGYQYRNIKIMVGNVASPDTFLNLAKAGADYIRIGIGNGSACTTTVQTGIGYPMASLIKECSIMKYENGLSTQIVADGGFRNYSEIIKALALGADYVMIGSIISQSLEASGPVYWKGIKIANGNNKLVEFMFDSGFKLERKYRGLSTKEIQREWGRDEIKTSEGIVKYNPIKYRISSWKENFIDYLKSAMSYTASNTLQEFRNAKINIISQNSFNRFNK
jgi:GMP reductase